MLSAVNNKLPSSTYKIKRMKCVIVYKLLIIIRTKSCTREDNNNYNNVYLIKRPY